MPMRNEERVGSFLFWTTNKELPGEEDGCRLHGTRVQDELEA